MPNPIHRIRFQLTQAAPINDATPARYQKVNFRSCAQKKVPPEAGQETSSALCEQEIGEPQAEWTIGATMQKQPNGDR
jgi:hypothetical protein